MHRYHDEILRPIVVPFIHDHHLVLQHDNARPHVAKICRSDSWKLKVPVLVWPAYSPDMSPIEHVWDALHQRIRQRVPVPANIQQLHTTIEEEWMIDKGQWREFGQDTGVTPLLFTRSALGFLMTTESQDLGLTSHPKDGACWQCSVPVTIVRR